MDDGPLKFSAPEFVEALSQEMFEAKVNTFPKDQRIEGYGKLAPKRSKGLGQIDPDHIKCEALLTEYVVDLLLFSSLVALK